MDLLELFCSGYNSLIYYTQAQSERCLYLTDVLRWATVASSHWTHLQQADAQSDPQQPSATSVSSINYSAAA